MIMLFLLLSQYPFGQNKVQYKEYKWLTNETTHFTIYYHTGDEPLVSFGESVLESTYDFLKRDLFYREMKNEEKIPVIIYGSHNEFEETNILLQRIPESVGGFTESFKNRVVVPFDGSYKDFRHVLSHELVHVFQNRIWYGEGFGSINRRMTMNISLWFIEGMAEYFSLNWDPESDEIIRDAIINSSIIPLKTLDYYGGYILYKEGQSVLRYIGEHYGDRKIGDIVYAIRVTKSLDRAIKKELGITLDELDRRWEKELKKEYWPLLKDKTSIEDVTRRLTDHQKSKNFLNYAPSLSPNGEVIAYYRDNKGNIEIRLLSTLNQQNLGRLVSSGSGRKFESLHLLEGHISFLPDQEKVCFVSKESGQDVLYIFNILKRKVAKRISLGLDRIMWPEFSKDGNKITFSGVKNGASDIYVYYLKSGKLKDLTKDLFSDREPSFYGDKILFVSDRPEGNEWNYNKYALYSIDEGGNIEKVLSFGGSIHSPYGRDSLIYFLSDRDGIDNLYVYDLGKKGIYQLTDLIEGIQAYSIDRNGVEVALSCYINNGWDIFLFDNIKTVKRKMPNPSVDFKTRYYALTMNEFHGQKAPLNMGFDYLQSYLAYDPAYGLWGEFLFSISDMLGNHRISGYFNNTNLLYSDFSITYFYLPHRIDYGFNISRNSYLYYASSYTDTLIYTGELYGAGSIIRYPFNTFDRFDLEIDGYWMKENYYWIEDSLLVPAENPSNSYALFGFLTFVRDNTLWSGYAPVKGFRGLISGEIPFLYGKNFWNLYSAQMDLRNYWYFAPGWSLAIRGIVYAAWGSDKELLSTTYIGGEGTVRGYSYGEQVGSYAALFNLELRFPLIKRLELGLPPIKLGGIKGALFIDAGGATYNPSTYKLFRSVDGWPQLVDPMMSFGLEMKINLGITDFNFYVARRTDLQKILPGNYYSIYFGYAF